MPGVQYDSSSPEQGRGDGPQIAPILERGMRYVGEFASAEGGGGEE